MMLPHKVDHEGSSSSPLLVRQGSIYNLTLDEINNHLGNIGKPLNTMNLDELVKNVMSTEENQLMQNSSSSSTSSSSSSSSPSSAASAPKTYLGNAKWNHTTLSKKTIDEVWNEIVDQECGNAVNNLNLSCRRQLTLGETTLEEFLIRAGVVSLGKQESVTNPRPLSVFDHPMVLSKNPRAEWLHFQMDSDQDQNQFHNVPLPIQAGMDSPFQVSDISFENQVMDVNGYLENHPELPIAQQDGDSAASADPNLGAESYRPNTNEVMERSIQRRQRRMIKNRESAARSRARKQAYTKQLELDVARLKKINAWLRKLKEANEMIVESNIAAVEHRYQLRRTSSAPII